MRARELDEVVNPGNTYPITWTQRGGAVTAMADPLNWRALRREREDLEADMNTLFRSGRHEYALQIQDKTLPELVDRMRAARNEQIEVDFVTMGSSGIVQISFTRGNSYDITGGGNAGQVLSTVLAAITEYISRYHPVYIYFSAKGGSRSSLYLALIRRMKGSYRLLTPEQYTPDQREYLSAWRESDEAQFLLTNKPAAESNSDLRELSYTDPGIGKHMLSLGYRAAGAGLDQTTWIAPDGSVVKIFGTQEGQQGWTEDHRMFATWVQYCRKHVGNPYIPKFSGWRSFQYPEGSGQKYLQIRMERLTPIRDKTLRAVLEQFDHAVENGRTFASLESVVSGRLGWAWVIASPLFRDSVLFDTVTELNSIGDQKGWTLDLHADNFMRRGDQVIIVDPWVASG